MANKKGGGNNYTPIKNSDLLQGQPDKRTISQRVDDGKKPEAKKENEAWVKQAERTTPKERPSFQQKLAESRQKFATEKNISKNDPEKDK